MHNFNQNVFFYTVQIFYFENLLIWIGFFLLLVRVQNEQDGLSITDQLHC